MDDYNLDCQWCEYYDNCNKVEKDKELCEKFVDPFEEFLHL